MRQILLFIFCWVVSSGALADDVTVQPLAGVTSLEQAMAAPMLATGPEAETGKPPFWPADTWVRLSISPADDRGGDIVLTMDKHHLGEVVVYQPPLYAAERFEFMAPGDVLSAFMYQYAAPLKRESLTGTPVYLHVVKGRLNDHFKVMESAEYQTVANQFTAANIGARSVMLFIIIFVLFLWWKLRNKVYLQYAAFVLTALVLYMLHDGALFILTPALPDWSYWGMAYGVIGTLTYLAAAEFVFTYARLRFYVPQVVTAYRAAQAVLLLAAVALLFGASFDLYAELILIGWTSMALIILGSSWTAWRRGSRHAGFVLAGWFIFICAAINMLLGIAGIVPSTHIDYMVFILGVFVELTIFQFGLADLALSYRDERDSAMYLASRDALTGAYNRQGLKQIVDTMEQTMAGRATAYSVAMLDIDFFKKINDTYGHHIGDKCLKVFAEQVLSVLRDHDKLIRYGGEEFMVVLPTADERQAAAVGERIMTATRAILVDTETDDVAFTVSIGVSESASPTEFNKAVERADAALYRSKAGGRDRLTLASAPD